MFKKLKWLILPLLLSALESHATFSVPDRSAEISSRSISSPTSHPTFAHFALFVVSSSSDPSGSLQGAGGVGGLVALVTADDTYVYCMDANGNVVQMLDASDGSVEAQYEYSPFGELTASSGAMADENPFRFSTKYWDIETGLGYWGMRYYHPDLGRWLSRDPLGEEGGLLLYGFCFNSPVGLVDAIGQAVEYVPDSNFEERYVVEITRCYLDRLEDWEVANPGKEPSVIRLLWMRRQAKDDVLTGIAADAESMRAQLTELMLEDKHGLCARHRAANDASAAIGELYFGGDLPYTKQVTMDVAEGMPFMAIAGPPGASTTKLTSIKGLIRNIKFRLASLRSTFGGRNVLKQLWLKLSRSAPKSTAYRAVNPKYAQSTLDNGFYRSGVAGRLGNDGIYANSSVKGAVAEFQYHNPGVKPTVFEVNYPSGSTLNVNPPAGNFYIESPLPFTQGANVLTAPSLRESGTINYLIRSGATPGRIVQ